MKNHFQSDQEDQFACEDLDEFPGHKLPGLFEQWPEGSQDYINEVHQGNNMQDSMTYFK
jgi:hypothetical protein